MLEITTKSGAVYHIDEANDLWRKNYGPWNGTWVAHSIHSRDLMKWHERKDYEPLYFDIGSHVYVTAMEETWLSTPIVTVEEIEEINNDS